MEGMVQVATTEEIVIAQGYPSKLAAKWCKYEEDSIRERMRSTLGVQGGNDSSR